MRRRARGWEALGLLSGVSALLAVSVAALTNLVTNRWNPVLTAALLVMACIYASFEVWRARTGARDARVAQKMAEAIAEDAKTIATEATTRLMVAVDDILNPLLVLMDKANDASLSYENRMQYIGAAQGLIFEGMRRLIKPDGRVRTGYYKLQRTSVRSLRLWSSTGRSGTMPLQFTENDDTGKELFRRLDQGVGHQSSLVDGDACPEEITKGHPILAITPVWSSGEPVGVLVVDAPAHSEIAEEDLYLVDLFAKLLGLLTNRSDLPPEVEGDRDDR